MEIRKLKKRREFVDLSRNGQKVVLNNLILLYKASNDCLHETNNSYVRLGFVASKKIGNAVERNRAKRRLKAAVNLSITIHSAPFYDFVIIARKNVLKSDFIEIIKELNYALLKANLRKPL
ncbi:MAG: ribonuclease P protein component [Alphaproteobacteria bacterium]